MERLVDGNVEVGGDVAAHRDVGLGPGRVHVDQETRRDLDRRGITPGRARGVPHDRDRLRHVLDREPVEDGAVGHLAGDPEHAGSERRDMDGDRLGGWPREPEAVHAEGLAPEDDALAGERLAEELRHLAHARRGLREGAAVPGLDDRLGARADAEAEASGRDVGEPGGRGGERRGASGVDVGDRRPHAQPRRGRDDGDRGEAVHAVHLERPRVGVAEPLRLARELSVLGEAEAVDRHRQRPALLAHGAQRLPVCVIVALLASGCRATRFYCMIRPTS